MVRLFVSRILMLVRAQCFEEAPLGGEMELESVCVFAKWIVFLLKALQMV